ncbi:MAG: type II toxin-antitoxin system VapC family toxin, partial [Candidatus Sungiibacteriota bacterium]
MYTFDTNIIIYYLDRDSRVLPIVHEIFEQNSPVYVSAISEIELFGFSRLTDEEAVEIDGILRTVSLIPLDSRIARLATALRRNHGLKVADSAIAATALYTGSALLTRNV